MNNRPDLLQSLELPLIKLQKYRRYLPTAFDESLSILEKINNVINYLYEYSQITEEMLTKWNEVYNWILNDGLEELVRYRLDELVKDGTIADIINEEIFGDLNDKVNEVIKELEEVKKSLIEDIKNLHEKIDELIEQLKNDFNNLKEKTMNEIYSLMKKSHGGVYQKKVIEPFFGYGNNKIFDGAERANQGLAYVNHNGKEKIFMLSRVRGESWSSQERQRITEFNYKEDGSIVEHNSFSGILNLSHQGISAFVEDDQIVLICGANTGDGIDQSKGYSKVYWRGSQTNDSDVISYPLLGKTNSNHPLEMFNHATPTASPDGKYIVLLVASTLPGGIRYALVYDRKKVESYSNSLDCEPLNVFRVQPAPMTWGNVVQDVACDGSYIYISTGNPDPNSPNNLIIHEMNGIYVGYTRIDGSLGDYSLNQLKGNTLLGNPVQHEPEGLTIRGNELLYQTVDVWQDNQGNYTRRSKVIHKITNNSDGAKPINRGWQPLDSPAGLHLPSAKTKISYDKGDAFSIGAYDPEKRTLEETIRYSANHQLRLFDIRPKTTRNQHFTIAPYYNIEKGQYVTVRSDRTNNQGSGMNMHTSKSSNAGRISFHFGQGTPQGEHRLYMYVSAFGNGKLSPREDGKIDLGSADSRYKNVYATDGTIKTSDRNHKQDIKEIDDEVLDAWKDVNFVQYKMKESVKEKGNKARKHIGVIAQEIVEVFENHGLNAFDYGIVGYDEWEYQEEINETIPAEYDEDGKLISDSYIEEVQEEKQAGKIYTVRADECLFLESALMRRELNRLKENK